MIGRQPCFFCSRRATLQPLSGIDVCQGCALRIAALSTEPSEALWAKVASPERAASARSEARDNIDVDEMFETFKEGVARLIPKDDADSHLLLAEAYSEMGLYLDARREAAVAITSGATTRATTAALRLLLSAPLLSEDALDRLRERLLRPVN